MIYHRGQQKFLWSTADGSTAQEIWSADSFPTSTIYNTWHHLIMIRDNADNKHGYFYLDGVRKELASIPTILNIATNANQMRIGSCGASYNPYYWTGKLNDFRLYNHALSKKEAEEIAKGLVLHYKLDNNGMSNPNILTGTYYNSYSSGLSAGTTARNIDGKWAGGSGGNGSFSVTEDTTCPVGKYSWNILNNTSGNRDFQQGDQPYISGQIYTTSFWAKGTGTCLYRSWNTTDGKQMFAKTWTLSTNWTYYTYTFTASAEMETDRCTFHLGVTGSSSISICGMKMELGNKATSYSLAVGEMTEENIIYDSSGYNNNGTIIGEIELNKDSPRYTVATYINSPDPTTNSVTGEYYISANCCLVTPAKISIAWWANPENGYGGNISHAMWSTTANDISSDYQVSAFNHRDTGFDINSSDGVHLRLSTSSFVKNEWHHYAVIYDGQTAKLYKDGMQQTSVAFTVAKTLGTFTKILIGHSRAGGVHRKMKGKYSDFRVYVTALTEEQILELYHTSGTIDNKGNIYARELVE